MPSRIAWGNYGSSWEQQQNRDQGRGRAQQATAQQDDAARRQSPDWLPAQQQQGANQRVVFGNQQRGTSRPDAQAASGSRSRGNLISSTPDNWQHRARVELLNEQGAWPSSCYALKREGPNDLEGDVSREEARWAQLQAARAGASQAQLAGAYQRAVDTHRSQAQALLSQRQAPSDGGPPIPAPPNPWEGDGSGQQAAGLQSRFSSESVPATPQGQIAPAFGSRPPAGGFGQLPAAAGGFGASQPAAAGGFGAGQAAGGFGTMAFGQPGQARPVFGDAEADAAATKPGLSAGGQQAAGGRSSGFGTAFGTQQAQQGAAFGAAAQQGFGAQRSTALPAFGAAANPALPAFGAQSNAALPAFGRPPGQGPGQQPASTEVGMSDAAGAADGPSAANPWEAARFEPGKIPDEPPPQIFCH